MKKIYIILCLIMALFPLSNFAIGQQSVGTANRDRESMTITTYYPSPVGSYKELDVMMNKHIPQTFNGTRPLCDPTHALENEGKIYYGTDDTGNLSTKALWLCNGVEWIKLGVSSKEVLTKLRICDYYNRAAETEMTFSSRDIRHLSAQFTCVGEASQHLQNPVITEPNAEDNTGVAYYYPIKGQRVNLIDFEKGFEINLRDLPRAFYSFDVTSNKIYVDTYLVIDKMVDANTGKTIKQPGAEAAPKEQKAWQDILRDFRLAMPFRYFQPGLNIRLVRESNNIWIFGKQCKIMGEQYFEDKTLTDDDIAYGTDRSAHNWNVPGNYSVYENVAFSGESEITRGSQTESDFLYFFPLFFVKWPDNFRDDVTFEVMFDPQQKYTFTYHYETKVKFERINITAYLNLIYK